jgi:hypothetical protein
MQYAWLQRALITAKHVTYPLRIIGIDSNVRSCQLDSDSVGDSVDLCACVMELKTILADELYYALAVIFACVVSFGVGMLTALLL